MIYDADGKPNTLRYKAVKAILLNEFLKGHRTVQELKSNAAKQNFIPASAIGEGNRQRVCLRWLNDLLDTKIDMR